MNAPKILTGLVLEAAQAAGYTLDDVEMVVATREATHGDMPEDTPKKRGESLGSDPEFLTAFRPERRPPPKNSTPLTDGELARRMKED